MSGHWWTHEQAEKLRAMWLQGKSFTEIGIALGISRNAVSGKVFRLGLAHKPSLKQGVKL